MKKYSVIIISYNEEKYIKKCIRSVKAAIPDAEIILSDGGSSDHTLKIAEEENIIISHSPSGRGIQCSRGASEATGNIFLFLHGDTLLPSDAKEVLDKYFSNDKIKIGTFRLGFDEVNFLLRFYCWFTRFDSIFTNFGDQCITVRKDFYEKIGGFPDWVLYEDVEFLRRARKLTNIYTFPSEVITSARRFTKVGMIKQQLMNGWHILQFLIGSSPEKLALKYNSKRNNEGLKEINISIPKKKTQLKVKQN